jgi:multiple sugar transport system substrate-binding protein
MKRKFWFLLSVAVVAAMFVFTALPALAQGPDPWALEPMKETTTVKLMMEASPPARTLERFAAQIYDELNIDFQVIQVPFEEKYGLQLADLSSGNQQYDIYVHWPHYIPDLAPFLTPLKDIAPGGIDEVKRDLYWDDVLPGYQWVYMYKGEIYGTQIDGDVKLMHYRYDLANDPKEKEAFKAKYGYELDMNNITWDQALNVAEFFTRPDQNFYGIAEPAGFFNYFFFMDRFNGMGGLEFSYDDMTPFPDRDLALKVLQNGKDCFDKYSPPGSKSFTYSDANNALWVDGTAFMMPGWPDAWRMANDPATSKFVGKVAVSIMPGFERDGKIIHRPNMSGGRAMWIGSQSQVKEAAYKVLVFFANPEVTKYLVTDTTSWLDPFRKSHMVPEHFRTLCRDNFELCQIYVQVQTDSINSGYPEPQITGAPQYHDIIERYNGQVFGGKMEPQEALDNMVKEFDALTDKLGRDQQLKEWQAFVDGVLKPLNLYP